MATTFASSDTAPLISVIICCTTVTTRNILSRGWSQGKEPPGIHFIGGWVGPRAGLGDMHKRKFLTLPRLELRPLGRLARRQSFLLLTYLGSLISKVVVHIVPNVLYNVNPHPAHLSEVPRVTKNVSFMPVPEMTCAPPLCLRRRHFRFLSVWLHHLKRGSLPAFTFFSFVAKWIEWVRKLQRLPILALAANDAGNGWEICAECQCLCLRTYAMQRGRGSSVVPLDTYACFRGESDWGNGILYFVSQELLGWI
jgi:hypothetical protein